MKRGIGIAMWNSRGVGKVNRLVARRGRYYYSYESSYVNSQGRPHSATNNNSIAIRNMSTTLYQSLWKNHTTTRSYQYADAAFLSRPRCRCHRRWASSQQTTVSASDHHNHHAASIDGSKEEKEEDPYDKYRQGGRISPHILAELQLETLHTQRYFDPELLQRTQKQVQKAWNRQRTPPPEPGPMGTWVYGFKEEAPSGESSSTSPLLTRRIYQRTWNDDQGEETRQVVLELEPHDEVLSLSLSVDESCIGCLVENTITGQRQIRLRHIETDRQSTLEIVGDGNLYYSLVALEWGPMLEGDVHSLYFVGTDEQGRPDRVLVTTVHSTVLHVEEPQLIIHSQDPSEMVDCQRTKGCEYVSIHAMTKTSNEIYLSSGPFSLELVMPRQENVQYHLDVGNQDDIVMLVSDHGGDYRLIETSVGSLPLDPQTTLTPSIPSLDAAIRETVITDMDLFRDFLVLYQTSIVTGCPQITIQDRGSTGTSHSVTIPFTLLLNDTPCIRVSPAGNICFGATSLRLLVETPVTPPVTYELDFQSNTLPNVSESDFDSIPHQQERVFVSSRDGTLIPMSLFYQQDGVKEESSSSSSWWNWFAPGASSTNGSSSSSSEISRPVVLIGYGAYGESVNMGYDPCLVPLLEHGYVLAFAHTRGGGELGKSWYHAGRQEQKIKVIEDFEACAEYVRGRWKGKLAAKGFSAAGAMMGAAVNRRPDLFDNLVLTNPFLDVYATMTNPNLYLTAHEWEEFGNPLHDPRVGQILQSHCPTNNVASVTDNYPRCLLIGTLDDDNVPFWNPTIFAKKVRDRLSNKEKDHILLHIEEQGGHHLSQQRIQISSMELAFMLHDSE